MALSEQVSLRTVKESGLTVVMAWWRIWVALFIFTAGIIRIYIHSDIAVTLR